MIKRILTAIAASLAVAAPVHATPTNYTSLDLLELVQRNGIAVTVNENCPVDVLGNYQWVGMKRVINLCPGEEVDPIDHATVRHEVWHAIQHCVNTARGTSGETPVQDDLAELNSYVTEILSPSTIAYVKSNYKSSQWALELEANLAETIFTPLQLAEVFIDTCTAE